jgi:hypothetical protein
LYERAHALYAEADAANNAIAQLKTQMRLMATEKKRDALLADIA